MRLFPLRLIGDESSLDFMGKRWLGFAFSGALTALAIFLLVTRGLNWGIDFTGGLLMEVRAERAVDLAEMRPLFPASEFGEVSLQHFGDEQEVLIRMAVTDSTDQAALVDRVKDRLEGAGWQVEYRKTDYVGPTVGQELVRAGALAVGLSIIAILFYIWFRFEWQYGIGVALALVHDAIMTMGFFALSGYEFGLSSIAAVLTVLGYSVNDSVVIFDRVREMRRKYRKMPMLELLNKSINITLSRTLLTSGTTLMSVLALVLLGGEVIRAFAAAVLFGIAVGTYSSIYVSVPVLIYFNMADEDGLQDNEEPETEGKPA